MMGRRGGALILQRDFDRILFLCVMALVLIGIAFVYSATVENTQVVAPLHTRQALWALAGVIGIVVAIRLPLQFYFGASYILFIAVMLILLALLVVGGGEGGRWFAFSSGVRIQPSEPAKIVLVLAVARYLSGRLVNFRRARDYLIPLGLASIPFILVMRQPDLGTGMIFPVIIIPMLYWKGVPLWVIFLLCTPILSVITAFAPETWGVAMFIIALVVWRKKVKPGLAILVILVNIMLGILTPVVWDNLHEYQQNRILTFINPQNDPLGAGYQIIQSTVAVGSGGLTGKGYLQGTQTKLNFLPEQHTDFIYSVIAEETGMLGALIVLLLFAVVLQRILKAATEVRNTFAGLVIAGASGIMFAHIVVNIGMSLGLLPITGLPLPFISYGGSHLLSMMFLVGIVLGLRLRWMEY
ncbi:rod shape-determining protein RodA [Gemmatimonadota bacterium]